MKRSEVDINKLSPMMKEYVKTKNENEDVLLFYRLGDFYELFFEDATLCSHELELVLTGKSAGLDERVPMCGIPHHALNTYLEKLLNKGYKVAICEQMEDPKTTKGIVKREVIEIISPGTWTNTDAINEKDFNFIASITDFNYTYALSYADLLSGKVFTSFVSKSQEKLISVLSNLNIKEVVASSSFDKEILHILKTNYNVYISIMDDIDKKKRNIFTSINDQKLILNTQVLLTYLEKNKKQSLTHLQEVEFIDNNMFLLMNRQTVSSLELVETIKTKERHNSLLWFLDKTKTAMGSRLLKSYLISPLIDKKEIERRHNLLELFMKEFLLKSELSECLYEIYDLERLTGKLACSTVNALDLIQLKKSLKILPSINSILEKLNLKKLKTFNSIVTSLEKSIKEDASFSLKDGNIIKEGYNSELDELRSIRKNAKDFISKFENDERERTGIKTLKVGFNKVFGYYIEISKGQVKNIPPEYHYERRQTTTNCERFINPLLKEKESMILNAEEKINSLEYNLFSEIKEDIKGYISDLQILASQIAFYDVIVSLSTVSEENRFVKPTITNNASIEILDARHPVVEHVINDDYIPNDILMDEKINILIITGPNMSGKSTYMRTLAIIVVLNQIGCFVPAKKALLPVFDKIYTRIGATDDLVGGESTFMVEMKESAEALKNATKNSLIIFDELGRGTSTYDGMSLAGAIIEYIEKNIKCKTLFSTHYHELTKMGNDNKGIKNVHVTVTENNGEIRFLHKVNEGAVDKSYGVNVAKLAGLPSYVISKANEMLVMFESSKEETVVKQIELDLDTKTDELREYIKTINPLEITPIEALNILDEIKNKCEE